LSSEFSVENRRTVTPEYIHRYGWWGDIYVKILIRSILNKGMYKKICSIENLNLAFLKARKGKTKRRYVKRFQKDLEINLLKLNKALSSQGYKPNKLKTFVLRVPKTRRISKSAFKDRVVQNALGNVIIPLFEKLFIYDSHANQIGKGTHKAIKRFDKFKRKVSKNNTQKCYVFKADIKHYFREVDHEILIEIIKKKISDKKAIWLVKQILTNTIGEERSPFFTKGMPLGNLTSQFFANVYLNELDQFVKHKLKAKYYIRYVDDFVILHESKEQLEKWKLEIDNFLLEKLKLELHPSKSHVLNLSGGINFLGFRIFHHHKLLRKSNLKNFDKKFNNLRILFDEEILSREKVLEKLEGWLAYCSHADTFKYKKHLIRTFNKNFSHGNKLFIHNKKNYINYINRIGESKLKFSVQKTLLYYRSGFDIKEIALKQKVKESTIWAHLINLIEHKQLSVWEILPREKLINILGKIYSHKEKLRDIKKRLNSEITFDEIACVMASIKSKKRFNNNKCPVFE